MAGYRRQFRVQVLTPLGTACNCTAVSAVFPASDGLAGVLGGRAPVVALLGAVPLDVERIDGQRTSYYLSGGFAQMREDVLTILAEQCVPVEQLDPQQVTEEVAKAKAMPTDSPQAAARRREVLTAARMKLRVAKRRTPPRG
jgi:F-type H+-transporting ATPase subunit epsilon